PIRSRKFFPSPWRLASRTDGPRRSKASYRTRQRGMPAPPLTWDGIRYFLLAQCIPWRAMFTRRSSLLLGRLVAGQALAATVLAAVADSAVGALVVVAAEPFNPDYDHRIT